MIRVSLSGNIWLEDVVGSEYILQAPPKSIAYYEDNLENLDIVGGASDEYDDELTEGTHFHIRRAGKAFIVCPGGQCTLVDVRINMLTPQTVLRYDEIDNRWLQIEAKDTPRTIDRRRTIWQRLKSDD